MQKLFPQGLHQICYNLQVLLDYKWVENVIYTLDDLELVIDIWCHPKLT